MPSTKAPDFYRTVVKKATDEQQTAFLEQLFAKDADLRKQFQKFIATWQKDAEQNSQPVLSFVDLEKLRKKVHKKLSEMDFDMESVYKNFDQGERSYVPQYEAAWEGGETMLRKKGFNPFAKEALGFFKKDNLLDGVKVLLAMYEGHNDVFEPGYDEEDVFQEYNDTCLDIFQEKMHELLPFVSNIIKTDIAVKAVFDLIIERVKYWESKYKDSLVEDEWVDRNIVYDLKVFEPLFLTLLTSGDSANYLEQLLLKQDLKDQKTAKIFLKIAKLKGSQKDWTATAESFAANDRNIMQQLLDQYATEGRKTDLYRIAKKAFQLFPAKMYSSIFKVIQPEQDKDFYINVLSYSVKASREIEKYQVLKPYLNQEQRTIFIEENKNWMNFYVEMLAEEGRYEEILKIVKNHPSQADRWSSSKGDLNKIIIPILNIYPKECFKIIQLRVEGALQHGRGRGIYAGVTRWMQHLLKIKGYETKARQFINDLVEQYKNFRALKDEMRQGGII